MSSPSPIPTGDRVHRTSASKITAEVAKIDPVTWGMKYRKIRGRRYGFKILEKEKNNRRLWRFHRPFLEQPLADLRECKVTRKSRQAGVSENCITEEMWFCDVHDDSKVIHTFPREKLVIRFSNTRIDPMLQETAYLKALIGKTDQTFLKSIGNSFLILESAWSSELGESTDADMVIFDEKDRMKPGIEYAFEESLSSSNFGWTRYISTPTLPNRGVDEYYQKSDQHVWMVQCQACGKWQTITYPESFHQIKDYPIDAKTIPDNSWEFVCKHCHKPKLDRWRGFWHSLIPSNKSVAGYQITQMCCIWISATEIMQKEKKYRYKNIWYNYVLGLPYRSDDELVSEADFLQCHLQNAGWQLQQTRPRGMTYVAAGIDWGDISWCVVFGKGSDGKTYLIDLMIVPKGSGVMEDAKEFARRLKLHKPDVIIGDAGYGKDSNAFMLQQFPGIFYASYNPRTPRGTRIFNPQWSEGEAKVNSDRTMILKQACHLFKRHDQTVMPDPFGLDSVKSFVSHFQNLVLTIEEDESENVIGDEYERISSVGDDHFALAAAYCLMGLNRYEVFGSPFDFSF